MDSPRIAGLDVGFSTTKPTAGIGLWVDSRLELTNCYGVEACARIAAAGDYDIVVIDGPVIPEGHDIRQRRNVRLTSSSSFRDPGADVTMILGQR